MPTPEPHYRIALGENSGQHSWIIQSAKGIKWHNVPDELATLLQKLSVNELLDVSLGSDGRWYVKYLENGFGTRKELSSNLRKELGQGPYVSFDKLALGPGSNHWGVERGSSQPFSSVSQDDRFTRLLVSKTNNHTLNDQIGFVSLGFGGSWAFGVKSQVEYRCGKLFQNQLTDGQKARKRVSTVIFSPMARVWIIVWEDGTLTHNLPSDIATEINVYCRWQHSLKPKLSPPNSERPKAQKAGHPPNPQPGTNSSAQSQQSPAAANSTEVKKQRLTQNESWTSAQQSSMNQTIKGPLITTVLHFPPWLESIMKAVEATQSTPPARSEPLLAWQDTDLSGRTTSRSGYTSWGLEADSRNPYIYVPPKKLSTTLRSLDPFLWPDWKEYEKIVRLFENGWKHPDRQLPKVKRIFVIDLPDYLIESYNEYKDVLELRNGWNGINEQLMFHGTARDCSLGEQEVYNKLCEKGNCRLCSILRTSFLVSKAGSAGRTFKRFGPGIYTSSVSSKADDYAKEQLYTDNRFKVMIVAKVALGRSSIHYTTAEDLTGPPWGYDSVTGGVGLGLNYDEQVVYKNEAIRPAYVVVYERPIHPSFIITARPAPQPTWSNTNMMTMTSSSNLNYCTIM